MTKTELLTTAAQGALVLTSNERLSRDLVARYDQQMVDSGSTTWTPPHIFSFDGWLSRCIKQLGQDWRVLSKASALRLWETVIGTETSGSELELLQMGATARLAQQAYRLMIEYDCLDHAHPLTDDQKEFERWAKAYREACVENNWIDGSERASIVYAAINGGLLELPDQICFVGFDQWSPHQQWLCKIQEQKGGQAYPVLFELSSSATVGRITCADADAELTTAARWARQLVEVNPDLSIGIVVLDLAQRRNRVERLVRAEIDPQSLLLQDDEEPSFSVSLGAPLIEQGAVHAALTILSLQHRLTLEQASVLLRNPYLGGSVHEADARAKLDSWIRGFRQQDLSLKRFIELVQEQGSLPITVKVFTAIQEGLLSTAKRLPGAWGQFFDSLLSQAGWPGERGLSSSEYQVVNSWREKLLPAFVSLDQTSEPISRGQALGLLKRLAAETEFQVKAPTSSVQVLGQLESAGLSFDYLWVAGTSADNIPSSANPNPFLPVPLQVERDMPHATPERELEFSRKVIGRLACAAPNVFFSYPALQGDCEVRPSPLIMNFPESNCVVAEPHDPYACYTATAVPLEELKDHQGPPLAAGYGSGGTGLIKDQSLCPFRAFAHWRLKIRGLEPGQPGLDQRTRGDLLHNVLERFWKEIKTQAALLALSDAERGAEIEHHIETSLSDYFTKKVSPAERVLDLERQRLQAVVEEWLQVEIERQPFTVVETETEHYATIGPLTIKTLIDRIDLLAGDKRAVIDYKTGRVKHEALIAERLLEPQLPIYTLAGEAAAVAFASVRRGECKMQGVSEDDDMLPKVAAVAGNKKAKDMEISTWEELRALWRGQLHQLAEDYVAGKADVDPVSYQDACQYCDLAPLCRLSETKLDSGEGI